MKNAYRNFFKSWIHTPQISRTAENEGHLPSFMLHAQKKLVLWGGLKWQLNIRPLGAEL